MTHAQLTALCHQFNFQYQLCVAATTALDKDSHEYQYLHFLAGVNALLNDAFLAALKVTPETNVSEFNPN